MMYAKVTVVGDGFTVDHEDVIVSPSPDELVLRKQILGREIVVAVFAPNKWQYWLGDVADQGVKPAGTPPVAALPA